MLLQPQPGPQTLFLSSLADIVIFGGAAGGGKTYALLLEALRHFNNPFFNSMTFRRNSVQIRNPGGLWDTSIQMFYPTGAKPRQSVLEWKFPSGMSTKFAHLEHANTVFNYQGAQVPLIMWDELVHFEESQFWYMMSRLRSCSGVAGYMRATCNPDADSWVRKLIDWWIGEDGYAINERSGQIRWFIKQDDELIWADSAEWLIEKYGSTQLPKSLTFIPSSIYDNKILMGNDPSYLSNLMALSRVDRMRLLGANWNVRPSAGMYFQREWFQILDVLPNGWTRCVRYWDRAATKPNEDNRDPDWTRGAKVYQYPNGLFVIVHMAGFRDTPLQIETAVKNIASQDGLEVEIYVEQEPGSSGVADADNFVRLLAGYAAYVRKPSKDKITRALPASAQAERGNIKLLKGNWNEAFLREAENFPPEKNSRAHDDQIDALTGAINELCSEVSILDSS